MSCLKNNRYFYERKHEVVNLFMIFSKVKIELKFLKTHLQIEVLLFLAQKLGLNSYQLCSYKKAMPIICHWHQLFISYTIFILYR